METTLHRQLKALYSDDTACQEVTLDGYRIDAIVDDCLIEVQYGSLGALRGKLQRLLEEHRILVVKPIAARTYLIKRRRRGGKIDSARYSPSRHTYFHLFDDLVHFVDVFPHPNLTLEVVLTEQEEHRVTALRRRWRSKGFCVEDRMLRNVIDRRQFRRAKDLADLLPTDLQEPFTTADVAEEADIPRWLAQKMAYCLRKTGAAEIAGKRGNAILYRCNKRARKAA